jgi:hypothetical protein
LANGGRIVLRIVPMSIAEANAYVEQFHRHNKPVGPRAKFALGVSDGDQLVGVAIVGRPVARLLQDGYTAEVLRTCCREPAPKGANSCLYAACWRAWRAMGGTKLITYTLASESGVSLAGAGWAVVAECKGSKTGWSRDGRERDWQPIYGQQKLRWQVEA